MATTPRRWDQSGKPVKLLAHGKLDVLRAIGEGFRQSIEKLKNLKAIDGTFRARIDAR
jgi:hypothetical protein